MERIYSNKILQAYLAYLEKHHGKDVADKVIAELGVDRLILVESAGFHSNEFTIRFTEAAIKHTGQADLPYRVGRSLEESLGRVTGMAMGLTSPSLCMKLLSQVECKMARKTLITSEAIGENRYRILASFKDGFQESRFACQNRIGSYESISRFFGLPYARVEHPKCVFQEGDRCEYIVTIPEYGFLLFKRLAFALILMGVVIGSLVLTARLAESYMLPAILGLFGGLAAFTWYEHERARHSLQWTLLANEGLERQYQELEKNNAEINSVQDLTLSLGQTLHVQATCDLAVSTLVRNFGYESSQIWILNENGTRLQCRAAQGYASEVAALIKSPDYAEEQGGANPFALLERTLKRGETLVGNDYAADMGGIPARAGAFFALLKPSSFMITPLFQGESPIGILTAENLHGRKLDQHDRLLFQSISHIVANALVKAGLFEQMAEKIRQLQVAKEMAIQSEKLSSLGQMVAGVAHEINNPLNFLVNIMPDVRRDVDGLEKIRAIALQVAGKDAAAAKRIRAVDEEFDLESHLEEKEFVFGKISKSIQKGLQIAGSLKVFSRTSSKEAVTEESFAAMISDVLDLIPPKVRGETKITVDISPDLRWQVNKNEMEQAFLAVINNAIDALEKKGNVRVEGKTWLGDILISIRDDGPGIPANILEKIFEAFYTTKPPGKGTGLGLSITVEIVKKFGGTLAVESEPGKGTTFIYRFPKPMG